MIDAEAMLHEASVQIAGLAKRCITQAGQLAAAQKRIAELEKMLAEKRVKAK
jgi:hypothetical protein